MASAIPLLLHIFIAKMAKRARKPRESALEKPDTRVAEQVERPAPPGHLGEREREVWRQVVDSMPADWLSAAALPLLEQYCGHVVEARRLTEWIERAEETQPLEIDDYERLLRMRERESRALAAAAAKMQLLPQARAQPGGLRTLWAARKPWEG